MCHSENSGLHSVRDAMIEKRSLETKDVLERAKEIGSERGYIPNSQTVGSARRILKSEGITDLNKPDQLEKLIKYQKRMGINKLGRNNTESNSCNSKKVEVEKHEDYFIFTRESIKKGADFCSEMGGVEAAIELLLTLKDISKYYL